jgi:hypothetical protein
MIEAEREITLCFSLLTAKLLNCETQGDLYCYWHTVIVAHPHFILET